MAKRRLIWEQSYHNPMPGPFELAMSLLSLMAILVVLAIYGLDMDPEMKRLLKKFDTYFCLLFLTNFAVSWFRAEDRRMYLRRHWIDAVASIPLIEPLRWLRIFQLLRVMRTLRNLSQLFDSLQRDPTQLAIASLLALLTVILTLCSVIMLHFEQYGDGPITTAGDALWWGLVTISTVGYGDFVPITAAGKIVASVLIVSGVGMFGAITGLIASKMLARHQAGQVDDDQQAQVADQLAQIQEELRALRGELNQLRQTDLDKQPQNNNQKNQRNHKDQESPGR